METESLLRLQGFKVLERSHVSQGVSSVFGVIIDRLRFSCFLLIKASLIAPYWKMF